MYNFLRPVRKKGKIIIFLFALIFLELILVSHNAQREIREREML